MSDERIDSLVDRPKVKGDIDFVNELLSKVLQNIKDINGIKINIDAAKGMADTARAAEQASVKVTEITTNTAKLQAAEAALTTVLGQVDQRWREGALSLKENMKLMLQYESELSKVIEETKRLQDATNKNIGAQRASENRMLGLKEKALQLNTVMSELKRTINSQIKESNAVATSYDAMNQELGQMRNLYRSLSAEERSRPFGVELKKNIGVLDAELKKIDATMGNFQRNVGNYKSGWNGLGNSINQITRELPAFTYSVQTGFLAISNNLPILVDNIKQTAAQIKLMRAEGQKVPGLFSQLTTALLSWGTALSVGVTLLTVYGKEIADFFVGLFSGAKATKTLTDAQAELNEELSKGGGAYSQASQDISHLEQTIKLAKEGVVSKTEALKEFNDKIHLTSGEVKNLSDAEQFLIDNKDDYLKMMFQKALATAAYEKASGEALKAAAERAKTDAQSTDFISSGLAKSSDPKIQELYKKQAAKNRETAAAEALKDEALYKKIGDDALAAQAELAKKIGVLFGDPNGKGRKEKEDKVFKEGDAIRKAQYEIQKQILEDTRDANEKIAKDDEATFSRRIAANRKYQATLIALRQLEFGYQLTDINAKEIEDKKQAEREYKNLNERKRAIKYIEDSSNAQRKEAEIKFNSDISKLRERFSDERLNTLRASLKKYNEELSKSEQDQGEIAAGKLKNEYDGKLLRLDQQFGRGLLQEEQYNKKRLILQYEYNVKSLKLEIELAEKRVAIAKSEAAAKGDVQSFNSLEKAEQDLAALRIKLEQKVADFKISQNKRGNDAIRKDIEAFSNYSRLAVDLFDQAGGILNARYEREKNRIQEQIDLLEKKRSTEIEAIEATTASEEEKAARIAQINARSDAQKTALEQKQRLAQQKQARFDKAINIATIIQETAVAVIRALGMKPWTPANIALAAGVGALGVAKLAVAAATPIPQYAGGTGDKDHPGGPAIVGDGGKPELVLTPSGKSYITPDKSTLVNLPKGTKVFPDANEVMEVVQHMAFKQMPVQRITENNYSEQMVQALMGEIALLRETVKNKETVTINATRAGLSAMHKQHNNFWEYIGTNVR